MKARSRLRRWLSEFARRFVLEEEPPHRSVEESEAVPRTHSSVIPVEIKERLRARWLEIEGEGAA